MTRSDLTAPACSSRAASFDRRGQGAARKDAGIDRATEIAKALGIVWASVYRMLEVLTWPIRLKFRTRTVFGRRVEVAWVNSREADDRQS
jgi:hypothetical protein